MDLLAIKQSKSFKTLNDRIQELVKQLQNQHAISVASSKDVQRSLADIAVQGERIQNSVASGQETVRQDIIGLRSDVEKRFDDLDLRDAGEELLTSLFYPEHESRRDMLNPPWHRTFDWVLDENDFALRDDLSRWSNFPKWLREESGIYWISGRAASGKSTLMAYLINASSTEANLRTWASQKPLHIISFFFWRPGSALQRGVQGMLRSLLYQLLEQVPGLAEEIIRQYPFSSNRIPAWSESKLRRMLHSAIKTACALQHCVSIFIDGLDEFDGEVDELLQLVFAVEHYDNVKCCVSSRPETELFLGLSRCAHLQLEKLNHKDISDFVHGKLASSAPTAAFVEKLSHEISRRAQGVFLWAVLVTQSILRGMAAGDDSTLLRSRLSAIPSDMNALFSKMLSEIDEVHKRSLAFYLKAMDLLHQEDNGWLKCTPNIALLAASKTQEDPVNYGGFIKTCERVHKEIVAQSKGLLEAHDESPRISYPKQWTVRQNQTELVNSLSSSTSKGRQEILRFRQTETLDWRAQQLVQYEHTTAQWVHRTAYDFIFTHEPDIVRTILCMVTHTEVAEALVEGSMKLLVALPSLYPTTGPLEPALGLRAVSSARMIAQMTPELGATVFDYFDEIESLIEKSNLEELRSSYALSFPLGEDHRFLYYDSHFSDAGRVKPQNSLPKDWERDSIKLIIWEDCVAFGFYCYIKSILPEIRKCHHGPSALALFVLLAAREPEAQWLGTPRLHNGFARQRTVQWSETPRIRERIEFVTECLDLLRRTYVTALSERKSSHLPFEFIIDILSTPFDWHGHLSWQPLGSTEDAFTSWVEFNVVRDLVLALVVHWIKSCAEWCHWNDDTDKATSFDLWSTLKSMASLLDVWSVSVGIRLNLPSNLRYDVKSGEI